MTTTEQDMADRGYPSFARVAYRRGPFASREATKVRAQYDRALRDLNRIPERAEGEYPPPDPDEGHGCHAIRRDDGGRFYKITRSIPQPYQAPGVGVFTIMGEPVQTPGGPFTIAQQAERAARWPLDDENGDCA